MIVCGERFRRGYILRFVYLRISENLRKYINVSYSQSIVAEVALRENLILKIQVQNVIKVFSLMEGLPSFIHNTFRSDCKQVSLYVTVLQCLHGYAWFSQKIVLTIYHDGIPEAFKDQQTHFT